MARRRRKFTKEYKREVVRLVRDSGKGVTAMAKELGLGVTVVRGWITMVEAEEKTGLTGDELEELKQLRKDKARLEMEVEILGKATAFFAKRNT
jgi:transposase